MAKDKKSFILYCDLIHTVDQLTDEQSGRLFKHILHYVNDKNPETDDVITKIAFEPIKQQLKRDLDKYESIRQRNSENARKRWDATASSGIPKDTKNADNGNDNVTDNDTDIKKRVRRFVKPTINDIKQQYPTVDAERFYNYYESNGWKVGKNPMKDWKAAARNWLLKDKPLNSNKPPKATLDD